jgi:putative transposase
MIQEEFPELKQRYWGQHLWARGYFCATVGSVDAETIRQYVESQELSEKRDNFGITE